jgi:hypothetical protein
MKFKLPSFDAAQTAVKRFLPAIGIAAVCCAAAAYFLFSSTPESFPAIPGGTYVGRWNGADGKAGPGLYAERITGTNSLLFVVFENGWTPQAVPLKTFAQRSSTSAFRPLTLSHEHVVYTLLGDESGDGFRGEIRASNGRNGTWELHPVSSSSLKDSLALTPEDFDLKSWLTAKVGYNASRDEIDALRVSHEQSSGKYDKLERFVKDEDTLKDRSRSRIDELESEINRVTAERKKSTQDLKNALSDLTLLTKIKARGQIVDFDRRIARRENKWYGINWAADGSAGEDVQQQLAAQENVDLKKLDAEVKRAEEIQRLQATITQEQSKIQQLQALFDQRTNPAPQTPEPAPEQENSKPWWKSWDAISG